ncbi:MAG: Maf family protein [Candidatus Pacebacteria bacterium]|nr:Maf family protein [Candidatus Paceibacterota bacterium]
MPTKKTKTRLSRRIILASTSPRRKEILDKTMLLFEIQESFYEEDMTLKMSPEKLAEYLSLGKAKSVADKNPDAIIISADTFVVYDNKCLGKPKTKLLAKKMLTMLSGKKHEIITGVTIIDTSNNHTISFHGTTKIFMKKLSPQIINSYIKTGEPLDKAGGYALQEIGAILIEKIDGDFFNAMGLPINRLTEELKAFGIKIL